MASVTAFIRVSKKKIDYASIRYRLRDGRNVQLFHVSELEVNPIYWDSAKQQIKAKVIFNADERLTINKGVAERKNIIMELYNAESNKEGLTSEWLDGAIDQCLHPEKYESEGAKKLTFFERFSEFLEARKLSDVRTRNFMVIYRALQRYEMYVTTIQHKAFKLDIDTITGDTLRGFEDFLINEYLYVHKYPSLYKAFHVSRTPKQRGRNTLNSIFIKLRTFCIWCNDTGKTTNTPFKNFTIKESAYGTPYYITIDERNKLYNTDFSSNPQLSMQRDIFVFQCLVGCRIGDLIKMTKSNVINGAIEYIPRKTKEGRPITVRVPLNSIALEILNKHKDIEVCKLFPFISEQKYNRYIKKMFLGAELTRMVTVTNSISGEEEKQPLNEIASSHIARRCFVGNLYKQVKDPNLVSALSGHKEGSKAFGRYREIDEQMKTDLVKMLE